MATLGTIQNGVVVFDPDTGPVQDGTRVEVSLRTGMEPLIRKTLGVIGGDACIGNRRIAVWMVVEYRDEGLSDDEIRDLYESPLSREELAAAWEYAAANAKEIEDALRRQDEE